MRASDFPGAKLQMAVSHLTWVLGTELWSSARTINTFNSVLSTPPPHTTTTIINNNDNVPEVLNLELI